MRAALIVTALLLVGCGGGDASSASTSTSHEGEVGATRESREVSSGSIDPAVTAQAEEPMRADGPPRLVLRPIEDVTEAEDGHGETVPAVRAVAFDLDARLVPTSSRDPELHVGGLVLERYESPLPGILRFVLADRDEVTEGMEVTVQYGDDESTRVVVMPALSLPW
jgi:hypothetical protein